MPGSVTVLAYHRIAAPATPPELAPTLIDAYPGDFESQMRYLAGNYNVISSWDLVRGIQRGHKLPRRAAIITFDDGYGCFKETAWPILKRLSLPVTLFVPTYYPSHPTEMFWWDALHRALAFSPKTLISLNSLEGPLHVSLATHGDRQLAFRGLVHRAERLDEAAAKELIERVLEACEVQPNRTSYMLNWEELADLAQQGVSLGPHTRNHTILAQVTPERALEEVAWSWSDLQAHIANPVPLFCYPNGKPYAISRAGVRAVRRSGLAGAFTMVGGLNRIGCTNPYLMYRIGAVAGESLRRFSLKISPAGRVYRRLKGAVRGKGRGKGEVFKL